MFSADFNLCYIPQQDDAYIHIYMQKIVLSSGVHQVKISASDLEMDTATVDKKSQVTTNRSEFLVILVIIRRVLKLYFNTQTRRIRYASILLMLQAGCSAVLCLN